MPDVVVAAAAADDVVAAAADDAVNVATKDLIQKLGLKGTAGDIAQALNAKTLTVSISPYEAAVGKDKSLAVEDVQKALNDIQGIVFDQKSISLALSMSPLNASLSLRVIESAVVDGVVVNGEVLIASSFGDAVNDKMLVVQRALADAILAAVNTYLGAL